jgi:hypothetical protein
MPCPFDYASEHDIKVQDNEDGLELGGTHQLLVCVDDGNFLDQNINIVKKNTGCLLDASRTVGLETNAESIRCMFVSRHQTTG